MDKNFAKNNYLISETSNKFSDLASRPDYEFFYIFRII